MIVKALSRVSVFPSFFSLLKLKDEVVVFAPEPIDLCLLLVLSDEFELVLVGAGGV